MDRITPTEKQLATAIAGWLRHIPKKVWDEMIEHKILEHYKRQSLRSKSLEMEFGEHIAAEMARNDWQVTHPKGENILAQVGDGRRS